MRATVEARFWAKVRKTDGCWLWTAARNRAGYGRLFIEKTADRKRFIDAHRISWELHFGEIPKGLYVCHHCDNPSCVRPDRLFVGTNSDNTRDSIAKGRNPQMLPRTHCPQGHALTPENTYLRPSKNPAHAPARVCRTCTREKTKQFEAKRRALNPEAARQRDREKTLRFRERRPDYYRERRRHQPPHP